MQEKKMNAPQHYQDLLVWKKSVALAKKIYQVTEHFPQSQLYSLTSQLQRASVSIASNIAEGAGRNGSKEFIYHIGIAMGSLYEVQTQLVIACDVGFISHEVKEDFDIEINEIGRMLNGLISSLKRKQM